MPSSDGESAAAGSDRPVVLVVEDEPDVAELYADWLARDYEVRVAGTAEKALERFDEDVAVALLDRRMPDASGDEVLADIRRRSENCRVAMVTAVDPNFDVLGLGFDDYLQKPVERDQLRGCVERLLALAAYDRELQEYYALLTKRSTLEAELPTETLEANEEYADLVERLDRYETVVAQRLDELSDADYARLFRRIGERHQPRR